MLLPSPNAFEPQPRMRAVIPLQLVFLAFLVPSLPGHEYDSYCWRQWTQHILDHGLVSAYGSGTDYPPVMQYVLWAFGKIAGSAESIEANYVYLRLLTYGVDLAGLYLVWRWTGRRAGFVLLTTLALLNIGSSYNTIVWGQVDGILATAVFGAIYLAWEERFVASGVALTVAVLFKMQAIIFIPVWGLLVVAGVLRERKWKPILTTIVAMTATASILFLPFVLTQDSRARLAEAIFGSVGRYPKISMNAYNWWHFLAWGHTDSVDSQVGLGGLSYKTWGLLAFFLASAVALTPMMAHAAKQITKTGGRAAFSREKLWLTSAIIALNFFYWPTQMHERYSHPALIFLLAFSVCTRDWTPYVLFSVAYFLNMEAVMHTMKLGSYGTLLFDARLDATLYTLLLLYLFLRLYGWRGFVPKQMPESSLALTP